MAILRQRNTELIPLYSLDITIAQGNGSLTDIGNEVMPNHHILRTYTHLIAQIALILIQRIVLIDILHIRIGLIRRVVALWLLVTVRRVALWHVDALIAFQNAGLALVQVTSTEIVVIIICRVVVPGRPHTVVDGYMAQEVRIGGIAALLLVRQSVQSHVLLGTGSASSGKGVGLGGLDGNLTPSRIVKRIGTINGHSTLIELLAITQNILAHLAQVDVQITTIATGIALVLGIDKGVQQPELDILHISSLEIVGVELTHHTSPAILGVAQPAVHVDIGSQVVRSTFIRIIGQVEHGQGVRGSAIGALVTVRIELVHIDGTHIVVAQLVKVALDVTGRQTRGAVGEQRVDGVPRQEGTIESTGHGILVGIFPECVRHTGDNPRLRFQHRDTIHRTLKIVDIRGIILRTTGRSCYQLRKLTRKGNLRRLCTMQQGQLVQHSCQPLALRLPVDVQSPQRILQGFRTHRHLRRKRLLTQMLQCTTYLEVFREVVFPVEAKHTLALHTIFAVAFQRHTDIRSCVDDALVEDGHLTSGIVHTIVGTFLQGDATRCHDNGALGHVIGTQGNDVG